MHIGRHGADEDDSEKSAPGSFGDPKFEPPFIFGGSLHVSSFFFFVHAIRMHILRFLCVDVSHIGKRAENCNKQSTPPEYEAITRTKHENDTSHASPMA